jgi:hypothetical protein
MAQCTKRALATKKTLATPRFPAGKALFIATGKLQTALVSTVSVCGEQHCNAFKVNRGLTTKSSLCV